MKTHRIGSITFGGILVVFGVLFLLSTIFNVLNYELICRAWPVVFVGLGIEVLLANIRYKSEFIYDWIAIWFMMLLILFGMGMAVLERVIQYYPNIGSA